MTFLVLDTGASHQQKIAFCFNGRLRIRIINNREEYSITQNIFKTFLMISIIFRENNNVKIIVKCCRIQSIFVILLMVHG